MSEGEGWKFFRFGLIVTGRGEEANLPSMFRALTVSGRCHFEVIRWIGQRSPVTSAKQQLKMVGSGKTIPDRDAMEIGLPARQWLDKGTSRFVVLVDDLEHDRRDTAREVFRRYRRTLDSMLGSRSKLASVHFLVNMLEAYYFADARVLNDVLGTSLADYEDDVEDIRHPKEELKKLCLFDERADCAGILGSLDFEHILARPETCASLRVVFAWCSAAMGVPPTERFCLDRGAYDIVIGPQLAAFPTPADSPARDHL